MTTVTILTFLVGSWLTGYLNGLLVGVIRYQWRAWTS